MSDAVFGEVLQLPGGSVRISGHLDTVRGTGVRPVRLPTRYWHRFPPEGAALRSIVSMASGVRLSCRTAATTLRLTVRCTRVDFGGVAGRVNGFVAEVRGRGVGRVTAPVDAVEHAEPFGTSSRIESLRDGSMLVFGALPPGEKDLTVWLPTGMIVDLIDVSGDEPVVADVPARHPVWLHHGSSISHCAEPDWPTSAWPVVAGGIAGLDVINLGFGGQCMLDPFVADAIAATPADVITLKIGVNIVGAHAMDRRTFVPALHGFLDRVRRGHPVTPIVVCSSILWPGSEDRPGPSDVELLDGGRVRCFTAGPLDHLEKGALTMTEARRQVAYAVSVRQAEGELVHYLDGLRLYGGDDVAMFVMPDSLHPDASLYEEMGRRFARLVFGPHGLVPRPTIGRVV